VISGKSGVKLGRTSRRHSTIYCRPAAYAESMVELSTIRPHIRSLVPRTNLNLLKTVLFYYVLAVYAVKAKRHLAARGIITTIKEIYTWTAKVCIFYTSF